MSVKDNPCDEKLVADCLAFPADRLAWETLYKRFYSKVLARIRSGFRLFSSDEAEDVAQEVFVKLASGALRNFRGDSGLQTYICLVADSVRISENRKKHAAKRDVQKTDSIDAAMESESAYGADDRARGARSIERALSTLDGNPQERYLEGERTEQLRVAISRLPRGRDRAIMDLHLKERKDREIADELGIPLGTVSWRRKQIERELSGLLAGRNPDSERPGKKGKKKTSTAKKTPAIRVTGNGEG